MMSEKDKQDIKELRSHSIGIGLGTGLGCFLGELSRITSGETSVLEQSLQTALVAISVPAIIYTISGIVVYVSDKYDSGENKNGKRKT